MPKEKKAGHVPEYTKRAINNYNAKFDRIAVNLPKGSREKILKTGKSVNQFFNDLFAEWEINQDTSPETEETGFKLPDGIDNIDSPFM